MGVQYYPSMNFRVVWDQLEDCPYLDDRQARLPLRVPSRPLTHEETDAALEAGFRRSGRMLYRTECPGCAECRPLRVPVARFTPTASQRRAWKRNLGEVQIRVGAPELTSERLNLYNRHKLERGLARSDEPLGPTGYRA